MTRKLLCVCLIMLGTACARAADIEGVRVEDQVMAGGQTLVLNGVGVRHKLMFAKLYIGALYLTAKKTTAEEVFKEESGKSFAVDLGDVSEGGWSSLPLPDEVVAEVRTRKFGTLTYSRTADAMEDISLIDRARQKNISVYASAERRAATSVWIRADRLAAGARSRLSLSTPRVPLRRVGADSR